MEGQPGQAVGPHLSCMKGASGWVSAHHLKAQKKSACYHSTTPQDAWQVLQAQCGRGK